MVEHVKFDSLRLAERSHAQDIIRRVGRTVGVATHLRVCPSCLGQRTRPTGSRRAGPDRPRFRSDIEVAGASRGVTGFVATAAADLAHRGLHGYAPPGADATQSSRPSVEASAPPAVDEFAHGFLPTADSGKDIQSYEFGFCVAARAVLRDMHGTSNGNAEAAMAVSRQMRYELRQCSRGLQGSRTTEGIVGSAAKVSLSARIHEIGLIRIHPFEGLRSGRSRSLRADKTDRCVAACSGKHRR